MRTALFSVKAEVSHANATHGSFAWGFPPPTAWVGLMDAMNRQLDGVVLDGVAVLPLKVTSFVYKGGNGLKFSGPRSPLNKSASVPGIQETQAGYLNLKAHFVFKMRVEGKREDAEKKVRDLLTQMRFAGGTIWNVGTSWSHILTDVLEYAQPRWAFSTGLILRPDALESHWKKMQEVDPSVSKVTAWADLFSLHEKKPENSKEKSTWEQARDLKGWLVPITTGYQAVSPLYPANSIPDVRDSEKPFRFVESIWTVGEWVSPFRLEDIDEILFRPSFDPETNTYRCVTGPI